MGVNIFAPVNSADDAEAMVEFVNTTKSMGRFDWCDLFRGPGGYCLNLTDALSFKDDEAPWWVLTRGKIIKVKNRRHWQRMLIDSGCPKVIFIKARL